MSEIVQVDHVAVADSRLPSQFLRDPVVNSIRTDEGRTKTRMRTLIAILAQPFNDVEAAMFQILTERYIDTATGVTLYALGNLVGQRYAGEDEGTYRRLVRARVAVNRSTGTPANVYRVTRLLLNEAAAVLKFEPQYPASAVMRATNMAVSADLVQVVIGFLRDAIAGGVRIIFESMSDIDAHMLVCPPTTFVAVVPSIVGATALNVFPVTTGFPATGTLRLDAGLATDETVTYNHLNPTQFLLDAPTLYAHAVGCAVSLESGVGLGLGDSDNPSIGGALASAED